MVSQLAGGARRDDGVLKDQCFLDPGDLLAKREAALPKRVPHCCRLYVVRDGEDGWLRDGDRSDPLRRRIEIGATHGLDPSAVSVREACIYATTLYLYAIMICGIADRPA